MKCVGVVSRAVVVPDCDYGEVVYSYASIVVEVGGWVPVGGPWNGMVGEGDDGKVRDCHASGHVHISWRNEPDCAAGECVVVCDDLVLGLAYDYLCGHLVLGRAHAVGVP